MSDPQLISVKWADTTGTGFTRQDDGAPPPQPYVMAAQRLLNGDLSQPPEALRMTLPHPVWSMRTVDVGGQQLWCFVVQGRRGPFGVAGTCWYLFAEPGARPADVWTAGCELAAADHEDLERPDAGWLAAATLDVLTAVLVPGREQQALPGTPAQNRFAIEAALKALPDWAAERFTWSTCLLQRPSPISRPVFSGRWPEQFRAADPARAAQLDKVLPPPAPEDERLTVKLDAGRRRAALTALAGGEPLPEDLRRYPQDLVAVLDELAVRKHGLTWQDVASYAAANRMSELDHPGVEDKVEEWAHNRPRDAWDWIDRQRQDRLAVPAVRGLLAAQADRKFTLPLLGATGDVTDRQRDLAGLLRRALVSPAERLDEVTAWAGAGGPLSRPADLLRAHDFLLLLGIRPVDAPRLFPPRLAHIAAHIDAARALDDPAAEELGRAPVPFDAVIGLVGQLRRPVPVDVAASLLVWAIKDQQPLHREDIRRAVIRMVRQGTAERRQHLHAWVTDLLLGTGRAHVSRPPLREVMHAALSVVAEQRPKPLAKDDPLREVCLRIGVEQDAPPHVRKLLPLPPRPQYDDGRDPGGRFRWDEVPLPTRIMLAGGGVALVGVVVWAVMHAGQQPPAQTHASSQPLSSQSVSTATQGGGGPGPDNPPVAASVGLTVNVPIESPALRDEVVRALGADTRPVLRIIVTGYDDPKTLGGLGKAKTVGKLLQDHMIGDKRIPQLSGTTTVDTTAEPAGEKTPAGTVRIEFFFG
ncbi:hypothetical protein Daura_09960 [Dactylosporangium aurantiacum]|uniref:Uncharacterized protein n=1 Tax=Dactylosporangium aurantiacum TaxID=35754 RepID=A0A9Q9ILZ4_9ACTN|nr:hypothetical protein [Dactylosporangium aurantiacum]MDG6109359.1 hypothetical protein [Dactylosporangium aurantiacum]UWZ56465.1 hypothetical protein Daura_09960 [Dactylosporangium aurantiacum]